MWFRLKKADFSNVDGQPPKNLGTMTALSGSYFITWNVTGGLVKTNCPSYAVYDKETKKATLTATLTLAEGASLIGTPSSTSGTVTHTVSGTTVTVTVANISENCTVTIAATGSSSGGGGGITDTTTPVGVDKVLLSNYRSETGTTLNSGEYNTSAKDTHVTFFDIPINPSEVYYVSWGVRAWFLKSDKSPISTINFYTASDVGKAHYVMAPSNAAYMSVCISNMLEGYSLPDAYIQQASLSFTATSSQLVSATAGVSAMQDNKGLNSASYIVEDKDGSWVYEYIPIVAGQSYRIEGGVRSWFLNSSKTSISTVNLTQNLPKFTFTAPADAAYISVTFSNKQWTGEKDAVKIEEGTIDYTLK